MLSPLLKKLLFVRQLDMNEGKIQILGKRHIMLSDTALLELQEVDETKFYELMKSSTVKQMKDFVDKAKVYKQLKDTVFGDIGSLSKKIGSAEGVVKTAQDVFDLYGLGKIEIVKLENTKKEAVIRVKDSTIAKAYKTKNKKKSSKPVCVITAAVLAGIFTFLFKKKVDAGEDSCMAKSGSFCQFIIK